MCQTFRVNITWLRIGTTWEVHVIPANGEHDKSQSIARAASASCDASRGIHWISQCELREWLDLEDAKCVFTLLVKLHRCSHESEGWMTLVKSIKTTQITYQGMTDEYDKNRTQWSRDCILAGSVSVRRVFQCINTERICDQKLWIFRGVAWAHFDLTPRSKRRRRCPRSEELKSSQMNHWRDKPPYISARLQDIIMSTACCDILTY